MVRTKTREQRSPDEEEVKAARKRVKTALVERAAEAEKQCKVVVGALAVLRRLQTEVREVDSEKVSMRGDRGDDEFCDLIGEFIPSSKLKEIEDRMENAVENAARLVEEGGDDEVVVVGETAAVAVVTPVYRRRHPSP